MTPTQKMSIDCFTCDNCGYTTVAQKMLCSKCGGSNITAVKVDGKGKLIDFTIVSFAPENYKDLAPYTSVLVLLENGCKLFGIIKGENSDILEGNPLTMVGRDETRGAIFFELDEGLQK